MRKKIVAGNWKMNLNQTDAIDLFTEISNESIDNIERIVFSSFLFISDLVQRKTKVLVGAQNFYPEVKGAFTGEVSIDQLRSIGATHVLIGHSERRMLFGESNTFCKEKVDAALNHGINIVFCCGEPFDVREIGEEIAYVTKQLEESLYHLSETDISKITIAYEPIWAIGTGLTASVDQAEIMHAAIRKSIATKYSEEIANGISILYGGSCNASNAKELFACPNVDGGLIGGASLKSQDFSAICNSF
jgi:triosephosphate isomerase